MFLETHQVVKYFKMERNSSFIYFSCPSWLLRKLMESWRVLMVVTSLGNSLISGGSPTMASATRSELVKDRRQGRTSFLTL